MKSLNRAALILGALTGLLAPAFADEYVDTVAVFKNAGASAPFFKSAYAYAVFPTIGKGGFIVGAAHGDGRVFEHGNYIGDSSMTQVSVGFQAGGQAYSEIIFFEDAGVLKRFESGNFALSADVGAVAITASASATAGTEGSDAAAGATQHDARTLGHYQDGIAVFTLAKGGLMYQAAVAGQKFSYKPEK
ncbi:MAG TPA: lipid-binding SYLF domain-containing protein [Steroidobacteraceae bacterium]|nr:lipid-binding SYLF domain-containing protein [Steroidobacteraceae bacterium]